MAKERIPTIKGCWFTAPSISPKNWNTADANVNADWYIHYTFFDPFYSKEDKYKKGSREQIRGFATFKTLKEKQFAIKKTLEDLSADLKVYFWNPISQTYLTENTSAFTPTMPFVSALTIAASNLHLADSTVRDISQLIKTLPNTLKDIGLYDLKLGDVRKMHIKAIVTKLGGTGSDFSPHRYNKWKTYLSILLAELCEHEAVETNYTRDIKTAKKTRKKRVLITREERVQINDHLKANRYTFWRFINIFFESGSREVELLRLKVKDVNLEKQEFKVIIKKGREYREEFHVIKNSILYLWKEIMKDNLDPESYLFAENLCPAVRLKPIRSEQIQRRWRNYVKRDLGINKDMYLLKHTHTDAISALVGIATAAKHNAHSEEIAKKHYALGEEERTKELIKSLQISLS